MGMSNPYKILNMKRIAAVLTAALMSVMTLMAGEPAENSNESAVRPLKFAWGADVGASVDMTGHDMSALGISAMFGMEWKWVRFAGIGAEADVMVSNSSRVYPLSVIFRTDFSQRRRLLFMDLRGGVAPGYLSHDTQQTVPYASAGLGVTLASGRNYSSHLMLSYIYLGQKECYKGDELRDCPGLSFVQLRFGVNF